jgi:hypothetical protein
MSYLSMYTIHQDGSAKEHQRFGNAFRGAMLIWTWLVNKYLPGKSFIMMMGTDCQPLWDLAVSDKVKDAHRIVHANTFDRVAVKRENFSHLIAAMKIFIQDCEDPGHLPAQIEALEALQDNDVIAVGWCQTSVCQPHWGTRYDDEDKETPFNLADSTDHWFLFDEGELEKEVLA